MRRREMSKSNNVNTGMGIFGWLFIVLFILKLNPGGHLTTPVVDWSWWWVTAPLWAPFILVLIILVIVGAVYGIIKALK